MHISESQNLAITQISRPCVILAGAGTGKTRTIVEKVKYLINQKIYPAEKIVCITFSNEAANSINSRIFSSLNQAKNLPIIKTFHSFSADLLHERGSDDKNKFKILEPNEAKIMIHKNLRVPAMLCHKYISSIGIAKDIGITIEDIKSYYDKKSSRYKENEMERIFEKLQFELQTFYLRKEKGKNIIAAELSDIKQLLAIKKFFSAWAAYEKIKEKHNYKDYADLNIEALALLEKNPEITADYEYIIVDEFQDTNKIQLDLLLKLAPHGRITVVGDINQSIYRFRGAYNKNIQEFIRHFALGENEIFKLSRSYRSPDKILRQAHQLILNNYSRKEECFEVKNAHAREGEKIPIYELKNAKEEARKVAEIIEEETKKGLPLEEICVMFRAHQHGRVIKQVLELKKIPYCSVTKSSLLAQQSIKTIINCMMLLSELKNKSSGGEIAWWELIHALALQESDLATLGRFIKEKSGEALSVKLLNELEKTKTSDEARPLVQKLIERIKLMLPFLSEELPSLVKRVAHIAGIFNGEKNEKEALLNVEKFQELAKNYCALYESDLAGFLEYLEMTKSLNIEIPAPEIEERGVRLMTLHATKGLEYDTVILTNLAQRRFPIEKQSSNPFLPIEVLPEMKNNNQQDFFVQEDYEKEQQLLEERRLCYVAFTRAKKNLFLTYAENYGGKKYSPSQFLSEINYLENKDFSFFKDTDEKYPELEKHAETNAVIKNREEKSHQKNLVFSPSSLLLFADCQKKYEYRYLFNMPERKPPNWEAMKFGSFIHNILDSGVKRNLQSLNKFFELTHELHLKEEWQTVNIEEAEHLIKVFFERNKNKYDSKSRTEIKLEAEFDGLKFAGFADRIDISSEGVEIVDYKTGASVIAPKDRNWQLGFYALAADKFGKVKKITLDMLKHDKPLEFALGDSGNASATNSRGMDFNIYDVKKELISTAKQILAACENGFAPCAIEKNCDFCSEYFYS